MLGACDARDADWSSYYFGSSLRAENDRVASELAATATTTDAAAVLVVVRPTAKARATQAAVLYRRMATSYWRDPSYNAAP
mmetsp:Transcript_18010/g.58241  ORF Transcript_18010/g.58241 Transcript_18010/m.58241 type:complete len:81 (-) Transcript_18010:2789-3031(-)